MTPEEKFENTVLLWRRSFAVSLPSRKLKLARLEDLKTWDSQSEGREAKIKALEILLRLKP